MPEHVQTPADELQRRLDGEPLRGWLQHQRWYASKTRAVNAIEVAESVTLHDDPALVLALAQARFATGTHELYQLPLGIRRADGSEGSGDQPPAILRADDWTVYDALQDPRLALELLRRIDSCDDLDTPEGRFSFRRVEDAAALDEHAEVRAMGVEQSNSSVVFDNRLVLKVFRKLEAGINPELELLRFLTAREYQNIAPLHGWYEYDGHALAATLGVVQEFLPDAVDGWELALDEIVTDPERFLDRVGSLGAATAQMHTALASDPGDPAFSPEEPSHESISLLTATIDEDIERIFLRLPDDERLAPITGRGEEVRERLAARAHIGIGGKHIRIHGDYHLGQTLQTPRGWVILDFEGEPARPLPERRQKRSPLRDMASMLRSFAYVTSAVQLQRGEQAPAEFERRARDRFLEHYFAGIDPTLLPAGQSAIANMLAIFELEKAIYELRYELDNRPDWVSIPVAGIVRILESA